MKSSSSSGFPFEDVGARKDAGAVSVWRGGFMTTFTQDTSGVAGTAEAGDRFGASLTSGWWWSVDVTIQGVPGLLAL